MTRKPTWFGQLQTGGLVVMATLVLSVSTVCTASETAVTPETMPAGRQRSEDGAARVGTPEGMKHYAIVVSKGTAADKDWTGVVQALRRKYHGSFQVQDEGDPPLRKGEHRRVRFTAQRCSKWESSGEDGGQAQGGMGKTEWSGGETSCPATPSCPFSSSAGRLAAGSLPESSGAAAYAANSTPPYEEVTSLAVSASIPTAGLAVAGERMWTVDSTGTRLSVLAGRDPDGSWSAPEAVAPSATAGKRMAGLCYAGRDLLAVSSEGPDLLVFSPKDGRLVRSDHLQVSRPGAMAWLPEGSQGDTSGATILVAEEAGNRILAFAPVSRRLRFSFPAPSGNTTGLAWDGRWLWVADGADRSLYMVDLPSGRVITMVRLGFPPAALSCSEGILYTVDRDQRRVTGLRIDKSRKYVLGDRRRATVKCRVGARADGELYVALPSSTNRQMVVVAPDTVRRHDTAVDEWSQRAERYWVRGGDQVEMGIQADLYEVTYLFFPESIGGLEDIPAEVKSQYLVDGEQLQVSDPAIQDAAREVVERVNGRNAYWLAREVFDYTFTHVPYKKEGGWPAAPAVLKRGYGTCSPVTFVCVALSRACGLPARYAAGTRYRGSDPSLDTEFHRWAEVYLPGYGWVPVDPSGTNKECSPAGQAGTFGHIPDIDLVMMAGGGGSSFFGWGYNVGGVARDPAFQWSGIR
jgi:hypothetical protein